MDGSKVKLYRSFKIVLMNFSDRLVSDFLSVTLSLVRCKNGLVTSHWSLFETIKDNWRHYIILPYLLPYCWFFATFLTFNGNLPSHLPTNRAEVRKLRIMEILNSLENTWRSTYSFLKRPEDSWRSQKLRELWRTGEATPKATPCASLQPCLQF